MAATMPLSVIAVVFWALTASCIPHASGFTVVGTVASRPPSGAVYARPPKKRRRKTTPPPPTSSANVEVDSSSGVSSGGGGSSDELPDFDLVEEMVDETPQKMSSSSSSSPATTSGDPLEATISPDMMGSSDMPTKSIGQLISDRSLEKGLNFDDPDAAGDDSLPDLLALGKERQQQQQQPQVGKKRARQEARMAQALASKESEDEGDSILSKIPIDITGDDGKVAPLKIIENATWLGIFLLVGWEFYINSPLFDRVAPMAPVVY